MTVVTVVRVVAVVTEVTKKIPPKRFFLIKTIFNKKKIRHLKNKNFINQKLKCDKKQKLKM